VRNHIKYTKSLYHFTTGGTNETTYTETNDYRTQQKNLEMCKKKKTENGRDPYPKKIWRGSSIGLSQANSNAKKKKERKIRRTGIQEGMIHAKRKGVGVVMVRRDGERNDYERVSTCRRREKSKERKKHPCPSP